VPDPIAQAAWDRVADAIETSDSILHGIAHLTVGGEQSRTELGRAAALIEQAQALLKRVRATEDGPFHELLRLAPQQMQS